MPNPRYLYVSDQGRIFTSEDEPTEDDLDRCRVGILTIVQLPTLRAYGRDRQWRPIPAGELRTVEIDGERSPPFHWAAAKE